MIVPTVHGAYMGTKLEGYNGRTVLLDVRDDRLHLGSRDLLDEVLVLLPYLVGHPGLAARRALVLLGGESNGLHHVVVAADGIVDILPSCLPWRVRHLAVRRAVVGIYADDLGVGGHELLARRHWLGQAEMEEWPTFVLSDFDGVATIRESGYSDACGYTVSPHDL